MISRRLPLASERKSLRIADIVGMAVSLALLLAVLSAVVIVAPKLRPAPTELTHEEILENARKAALKAALAHREGSILFVNPETCQEHSFDNWTGDIAYKEQVDCDARLAKLRKSDVERSAERMRSVAEGFRR